MLDFDFLIVGIVLLAPCSGVSERFLACPVLRILCAQFRFSEENFFLQMILLFELFLSDFGLFYEPLGFYLYIGITSLCLYNTPEKWIFQEGITAKVKDVLL